MDKDRIKGISNQASGSAKKAAGKILGDAKLEAEGSAQKSSGKLQNAFGGVKDATKNAFKK